MPTGSGLAIQHAEAVVARYLLSSTMDITIDLIWSNAMGKDHLRKRFATKKVGAGSEIPSHWPHNLVPMYAAYFGGSSQEQKAKVHARRSESVNSTIALVAPIIRSCALNRVRRVVPHAMSAEVTGDD